MLAVAPLLLAVPAVVAAAPLLLAVPVVGASEVLPERPGLDVAGACNGAVALAVLPRRFLAFAACMTVYTLTLGDTVGCLFADITSCLSAKF